MPEVADGLVEIQNVAREPGYRSKIAVVSHANGVDPVGACVGPRGSRVRMVVSELRGEKIDIIPFNEEPARFVAKALSPARVREVLVDDDQQQATVIVPDDQLSLAIGKEGQNARLAARLTGWRVDIRSETEFAEDETDMGYEEEEVAGRCAAIRPSGKRCPNAALPGSRYCGLPTHQALEGQEGDVIGRGGRRRAGRVGGAGGARPGSRRGRCGAASRAGARARRTSSSGSPVRRARAVPDRRAAASGRGAYLCRDRECAEAALRRTPCQRALRAPAAVGRRDPRLDGRHGKEARPRDSEGARDPLEGGDRHAPGAPAST